MFDSAPEFKKKIQKKKILAFKWPYVVLFSFIVNSASQEAIGTFLRKQ